MRRAIITGLFGWVFVIIFYVSLKCSKSETWASVFDILLRLITLCVLTLAVYKAAPSFLVHWYFEALSSLGLGAFCCCFLKSDKSKYWSNRSFLEKMLFNTHSFCFFMTEGLPLKMVYYPFEKMSVAYRLLKEPINVY